jgi:hypothetical protein
MSRTRHYRPPVIRTEGCLHLHGKDIKDTPICIFPDTELMRKFHVPKKTGTWSWTLVDGKGEIVDQYRYRAPTRPKPITPYKGSWAESMATSH